MRAYECPFRPDVTVVEIHPDDGIDSNCGDLSVWFEKRGHAFCVYGEGVENPIIVIDERIRGEVWFTEDHIKAILAHELGHLERGEDEYQAERWAITYLDELGETASRDLLIERDIVPGVQLEEG